jgi:hypothetical protein
MPEIPRHQCVVYHGSPSVQLPGIAKFIYAKLEENYRCVYFNSPAMVAGIRSYLAAAGIDVAGEVKKGSLLLSSEESHLSDGKFDPSRMLDDLADAVLQALSDGYTGLYATGDMTWEFGNEQNFSRLLEYERGLEALFRRMPMLTGLCQYHTDTLPPDALQTALLTHGSICVNDTLRRLNPYYTPAGKERSRQVALPADLGELLERFRQP